MASRWSNGPANGRFASVNLVISPVGINDLKVDTTNPDKAITEFSQSYTSANYSDVVTKRMEWVREGNRWKIQREQVLEAPKISVPQLMKTGAEEKTRQKHTQKLQVQLTRRGKARCLSRGRCPSSCRAVDP